VSISAMGSGSRCGSKKAQRWRRSALKIKSGKWL
jgi:hypothetical protein